MKNRLTFLGLLGGLALIGCGPPADPCAGIICVDAVVTPDGGVPDAPATDTNRDAPPRTDTGPVACNTTGRVGAQCREGACGTGLTCGMPIVGMTVQQVFEIRQGTLADPDHEGYQGVEEPPTAANSAPFNALAGTMCLQVCNSAATMDDCGPCNTCSTLLTQMPLVNQLGGAIALLPTAMRAYGADSAVCRLDCTYDQATRGDFCSDDQTCDAFTSVCVEACTSDSECNTLYGVAYSGELVSIVNTEDPATCNATTGRCQRTGTAGATVGTPCEGNSDCAPGTGVCLSGGMCGELGCDTLNCGTGGLCLGINDHSTLCIAGCNTTMDCVEGAACLAFDGGPMGGFNGYCLGVCTDDSECRTTETCTNYVDDDGMAQNGQCVPRCTMVNGRGTAAGCEDDTQYCRQDSSGATYGFCRALGAFCTPDVPATTPGGSADCGAGQICDELLATGGGAGFGNRDLFGDGHCVDACTTDLDCAGTAGTVCQLVGPNAGLCRTPCSAVLPCTSANEMCDTVNMVCTEIPPPA